MKYRDHKGSLSDSMETVIELSGKWELYHHLLNTLPIVNFKGKRFRHSSFEINELEINKYVYDKRINWDTYIVILKGFGVVGFTDGPAE